MTRLLGVGLALLLLAAPARGQGALPYHGSEVFRFALHQQKVVPITSFHEAQTAPHSSLIVVLGDTRDLLQYIRSSADLYQFVRDGGAVLIATDSPTDNPNQFRPPAGLGLGDRGWASQFGITITGEHLTAGPNDTYQPTGRLRDGRPLVAPQPPDRRGSPWIPFELFQGIQPRGAQAIATDHPSEMIIAKQRAPMWQVTTLATYPIGTRRLSDGAPLLPERNNFAVSFAGPGGTRMLVLADQSVFANGMLGFVEDDSKQGYHFDNANWLFAERTIDWLQGGVHPPRSKCFFIENGKVIVKFADELTPPRPPIPNIPPDVLANLLLNHSNGVINELQERNFFNRMIESFFGFPRIVRAFLIVATILFLFYALRWLRRGQRKPEPAAATSPAQQAALLPRGGVLRQRTAAQLEVGNLSEAAGRRVRGRFDVLGGKPGPAGGMPPVLVALDIPDAPVLKQTVRWLWEIGYGDVPVNVPPVEWDRMNGLLERVTARAARGDWSFGQDVAG